MKRIVNFEFFSFGKVAVYICILLAFFSCRKSEFFDFTPPTSPIKIYHPDCGDDIILPLFSQTSIGFIFEKEIPPKFEDDYSYEWNFGDGQKASSRDMNHIYEKAGTYKVTLKIRYEDTEWLRERTIEVLPKHHLFGLEDEYIEPIAFMRNNGFFYSVCMTTIEPKTPSPVIYKWELFKFNTNFELLEKIKLPIQGDLSFFKQIYQTDNNSFIVSNLNFTEIDFNGKEIRKYSAYAATFSFINLIKGNYLYCVSGEISQSDSSNVQFVKSYLDKNDPNKIEIVKDIRINLSKDSLSAYNGTALIDNEEFILILSYRECCNKKPNIIIKFDSLGRRMWKKEFFGFLNGSFLLNDGYLFNVNLDNNFNNTYQNSLYNRKGEIVYQKNVPAKSTKLGIYKYVLDDLDRTYIINEMNQIKTFNKMGDEIWSQNYNLSCLDALSQIISLEDNRKLVMGKHILYDKGLKKIGTQLQLFVINKEGKIVD